MRESVGQAKSLAMNFFWQRGGGDFEGKLVLAPQKQKTALCGLHPKSWTLHIGFHIQPGVSARSSHADAYWYKTFRCNQKYCYWHRLPFRRSFSLSVHASVAKKSFLQPPCHDRYCDGSYSPPVRAISGTTAIHSLCI